MQTYAGLITLECWENYAHVHCKFYLGTTLDCSYTTLTFECLRQVESVHNSQTKLDMEMKLPSN